MPTSVVGFVLALAAASNACAEGAGVDAEPTCPTCPTARARVPSEPVGADAGSGSPGKDDGATGRGDASQLDGPADGFSAGDGAKSDGSHAEGGALDGGGDGAAAGDGGSNDAGGGVDSGADSGTVGVITGGPCLSGAQGATAFRIRWVNAGGRANVSYEVEGLPDRTRSRAGAYGYTIGFTPQYVDPFLAQGGLQLDSSDFVDLELSTVGVNAITKVTLSVYGRSFNTTTSGSFNWLTFVDSGSTTTNSVSNAAPYQWYSADVTSAVAPNDGGMRMRIKAGPSSNALVVNRIELCFMAN
jgi:hypothetical protein